MCSGRSTIFLAMLVSVQAVSIISTACGEETDRAAQIAQLIAELDHDEFAVRRRAHAKLIDFGQIALPALIDAGKSGSAEQRFRIRQILRQIQRRTLHTEFAEIVNRPDDKIDLDRGMWLIARILNPRVRREDLDGQLDEMAQRVRERLGDDVDPATAEPRKVVETLLLVLKDDYQLAGNQTNYDDPGNSSLERVLATRKGLPILLAHVAVSVGERLKLPIVGIPVPSRYMIKYEGARAPKGFPQHDIIIDPYGGWTILDVDEVQNVVRSFDPLRHLKPSPRRDTLARMLVNLASDLDGAQQTDKAGQVREVLAIVENTGNAVR